MESHLDYVHTEHFSPRHAKSGSCFSFIMAFILLEGIYYYLQIISCNFIPPQEPCYCLRTCIAIVHLLINLLDLVFYLKRHIFVCQCVCIYVYNLVFVYLISSNFTPLYEPCYCSKTCVALTHFTCWQFYPSILYILI